MRRWWRRLWSGGGGEPASGNGASSLHLIWEVPPVPLVEASAVLEVLRVPEVPRLVFWALQVTMTRSGERRGGAHIGLQWNPPFPGSTAANWGGYAPPDIGGLLSGSPSPLPSSRDDVNTRDFAWKVGRRYRLRVDRAEVAPPGMVAWRGTITDLVTGVESEVRHLYSDGDYLSAPMVWTESFSPCDHPGVVARWSNLTAVDITGAVLHPRHVEVNYQAADRGGCPNTTARPDGAGVLQETGVPRIVPQGTRLPLGADNR